MKIFSLFLLGLLPIISFSQNATSIDVNKDIAITKVYEQVIKEGYGTPKVYKDLANAYYFEGEYTSAKKWYEKLFESTSPEKITLFRYKQTLKALNISLEENKYVAATH